MSLSRVREEVSSKEFIEHLAFYQLFGHDSDRLELQLAQINSQIYNFMKRKIDPTLMAKDFLIKMPLYDRLKNGTKEEQQVDKMQKVMEQFTQAFNIGQMKKNGNNK